MTNEHFVSVPVLAEAYDRSHSEVQLLGTERSEARWSTVSPVHIPQGLCNWVRSVREDHGPSRRGHSVWPDVGLKRDAVDAILQTSEVSGNWLNAVTSANGWPQTNQALAICCMTRKAITREADLGQQRVPRKRESTIMRLPIQ